MIQYPASLPLGLVNGRTYQVTSPLQRSTLESGRARQRRRFTDVPVMTSVTWIFKNKSQAFAFEQWFRDALVDGAEWFTCPLKTDMGLIGAQCRFAEIYSGPTIVGPDVWSITANIEMFQRPLLPPPWGQFPDYITSGNIIDYALNKLWPKA